MNRPALLRASLCAAIAASCLLFNATYAVAATPSHEFVGTYGAATSTPADPYPLSEPNEVAVEQSTGDIYVTDPGNHRIEKFDSSGNFILMFGGEVNATKVAESQEPGNPHHVVSFEKNLCTSASGDTCQPGTPGSQPGYFVTPSYLAIDEYPGGEDDLYVGDTGDGQEGQCGEGHGACLYNLVQKFNASGQIISAWGVNGQKDGSDLVPFGALKGLALLPNGHLVVGTNFYEQRNTDSYDRAGNPLAFSTIRPALAFLRADAAGNLYSAAVHGEFGVTGEEAVQKEIAGEGEKGTRQMTSEGTTTGFSFDPDGGSLYQDSGPAHSVLNTGGITINHYANNCDPNEHPCTPVDSFGAGNLFDSRGVAVDGESGAVYAANFETNDVAIFRDIRPKATTAPSENASDTSITLTGQVSPSGNGPIVDCQFEYGIDASYGHVLPCSPSPSQNPPTSEFVEPTAVKATVSGLSPATEDHFRIVVTNAAGAVAESLDSTFITTAPPAIDSLVAEELTESTATVKAQINPHDLGTKYHLEYGTTLTYGDESPVVPAEELAASNADQAVIFELTELTPRVVYHYRLVAENSSGTTVSEDHTFNFSPPSCPNQNVRQQTQANYLPDCRAYELVSPGNAGGTQLYSGGPNTGKAVSPSRFSFVGLWGTIPGSGGSPIDGTGDLYVATRTDNGWVSRYIGLPSDQAAIVGGPPQGLPNSADGPLVFGGLSNAPLSYGAAPPSTVQNNVLTDPAMDTFLDWNDGNRNTGAGVYERFEHNFIPMASNAPYVWSADGSSKGRWPTNLPTVPPGSHLHLGPLHHEVLQTNPGGDQALDCPDSPDPNEQKQSDENACPGDVTASENLSHFVFASEWNMFAPGGLLSAPGSVYDNDTNTGTVSIASKLPDGDPIPAQPTDQAGDPLQIPAVSTDGSRILMASGAVGPCGSTTCDPVPCHNEVAQRCPLQSSKLYMREGNAVTYEIAAGHSVTYVGETSDGSKVYFTSAEQLTSQDHDSSVDLYMWSAKKAASAQPPLTLLSVGNEGTAGNTDECSAPWTPKCGVVTYSSHQPSCLTFGNIGGNCTSDNSIAAVNGDIYFFSPEQLDGSRGLPGQENLYVYHADHVQYVATFRSGPYCGLNNFSACSTTPVVRMQVSPNGQHMAFLSASQVTRYNNAGHLEMYTYESSSGKLQCVSCIPSGAPPTSNVSASQDGLFMADDGRTFFSTSDALVLADTNNGEDVYEFVDGRPQLITPGTGQTSLVAASEQVPGLIGVSASGTDVYFSTYDTLVPEDHNGLFLKFYDARTGGGFSAPPGGGPCEAADECHGPGSLPPASQQNETSASLPGGNAASPPRHKTRRGAKHRRGHRAKAHRASAANRHPRGTR